MNSSVSPDFRRSRTQTEVTRLNVHNFCQRSNLLQRVKLAAAGAGTASLRLLPRGFAGNVRVPEGPRLTLRWPDWIDRAFAVFIEKSAIAIRKLPERDSITDIPKMVNLHLSKTEILVFSNFLDFFGGQPNVSRGT